MKKIIKTLVFFLSLLAGVTTLAQEKETVESFTVSISFNKLNKQQSTLYVSLFNSAQNFVEKKSLKDFVKQIDAKQENITFSNLPKGEYAIICFQDLNNNQKLDFENFIPQEPWGVSNNIQLMGPPTWKTAKFTINENKKIIIQLF